MRQVVVYIAMSLDGYIADPQGGVDWLAGDGTDPAHEGSYEAFIQTVDTVVMGYRTYHQIRTELSPDKWVYDGKMSYIITHREGNPAPNIHFTADAAGLLRALKEKEGRDIWICGGASLVNQLTAQGLIDRYHITVIPTILGDGLRLFDRQEVEIQLRLTAARVYNGMVDLVYEKRT